MAGSKSIGYPSEFNIKLGTHQSTNKISLVCSFVGTLRNSTMMVILLSFQVRRTICRIFTDVKTLCFLPQICNASKCLEMPRNALTRLQNTYILYYHTSILSTVYNALEANFKSTVMRKSAKEFNTFGLLISSLIAKSKVPIHTYYLPH